MSMQRIKNEEIIESVEEMLEDEDDLLDDEIYKEDDDDFSNIDDEETKVRSADLKENAIEWYNGQNVITVTLSQKKLINKIMKLAHAYPNEVRVDKINDNGTILAHLPLSYLKFQKPRELTEEEKEKARIRLSKYRKNKKE